MTIYISILVFKNIKKIFVWGLVKIHIQSVYRIPMIGTTVAWIKKELSWISPNLLFIKPCSLIVVAFSL